MLEHLEEKVDNPYAIGMAAAMKSTGDEPPLKKSTITKAHKIAKGIVKNEEVEQIDEITDVTMKQLQKKFADGTHEAMNDPKPGRHVELRNTKTGKRSTHYVKEDLDETESYTHQVAGYYKHRGDDKPVSIKVNAASRKEAKEKASAMLRPNHTNYRSTTVIELTKEDLDEVKKVKPGHNAAVMSKNISKVLAAMKKEEVDLDEEHT